MAWDASRPVPWRKLLGLFGIYALVAIVVFSFTGGFDAGALIGLVIGGTMYVAFATVLIKFGWDPFARGAQRAEARAAAKQAKASGTSPSTPVDERPRPRPAPTSRTSVGPRTASSTKKRTAKRR